MVEYFIQTKGLYMEISFIMSCVEEKFKHAMANKDWACVAESAAALQYLQELPKSKPIDSVEIGLEPKPINYLDESNESELIEVTVSAPISEIANKIQAQQQIVEQSNKKKSIAFENIRNHELEDDDDSKIQNSSESDGYISCNDSLRRKFFAEYCDKPDIEYDFKKDIWIKYQELYSKHFTERQLIEREDKHGIKAQAELSATGCKLKKEGYYKIFKNGKYIRTDKPFDF